jgi:prepilin-type N-terminal cleavage/methylation domain-containing protein
VRGFTLIEVVISAALMALILTAAYMCLSAGIAGRKVVEPRADVIQNARVALALITADLRVACPLAKNIDFLGMNRMMGEVEADNLDFGTHNFTPQRAGEGDFCQESIYLDQDQTTKQYSLWRRRNPMFSQDPLAGGSKELIAQGLLGVRFEYTDGTDWYTTWGEVKGQARAENSNRDQPNLNGMPQAVRVTLLFDSEPSAKPSTGTTEHRPGPPMAFQTVVRLNLNDRNKDSSGGNSGGGNS